MEQILKIIQKKLRSKNVAYENLAILPNHENGNIIIKIRTRRGNETIDFSKEAILSDESEELEEWVKEIAKL